MADSGSQKRYDRQLRLWGAHGQARLESSNICALGAGPMCTEALKNLVLGGIASFTIVDNKTVGEEDLRNNFFYHPSSLGTGRAQAACSLLRELNDQVKGSFSDADVEEMLLSNPEFLSSYNLVIAEQVSSKKIERIDLLCRSQGAYLIVLRAQGPFASIQLSGPESCIIESKPENVPVDLRLAAAWPELQALADNTDLETCDDITHKHFPWALLLIKAIHEWRAEHGGPPAHAAERRQFKEQIRAKQRKIDGVPIEEENFEEAVNHAHTAWSLPSIPSSVKAVIEDSEAANLTSESSDFWITVAALRMFVENEGQGSLPLEGSIPDMTATTDLYLQLQRVYRARAKEHVSAVAGHVRTLLKGVGKSEGAISLEYIALFCKNARNLRVVRLPPAVRPPSQLDASCLRTKFEIEEQSNEAMILLALFAGDMFAEQHQRAPGETSSPEDPVWEQDIPLLQQLASQLASELGLPAGVVKQDLLLEFCRAAGPLMHTVAAVIGGIAAQEGLKLLLQQFVPLDGILVYNGIHASSAVLRV